MVHKLSLCLIISVLALFYLVTPSTAQTARPDKPASTEAQKNVFPRPVGYVNDFEDILTTEQINNLSHLLKQHEQQTTDQIAIVTLSSIKPYETLDAYSLDLANHWKLGQRGKNNGILIALAAGMGKIRIQNGYGIESRLTDEETKNILDKWMIPEFKNKNYYSGLLKGVQAILNELK